MQQITFLDKLLLDGHNPYINEVLQDFVIINCDEILDEMANGRDRRNAPDKPLFNATFYEAKNNRGLTIGIFLLRVFEIEHLDLLAKYNALTNETAKEVESAAELMKGCTLYSAVTYVRQSQVNPLFYGLVNISLLGVDSDGYFTKHQHNIGFINQEDSMRNFELSAYLISFANEHMHKKGELEFKQWSEKESKTIQKRYKKEPSPFFLLRVKNGKRSKYINKKENKDDSGKRREHIVRGHFRNVENHPIEHFNGTFWIDAHKRGSSSEGTINKGYKVIPMEK